jgi:hypothetical protein
MRSTAENNAMEFMWRHTAIVCSQLFGEGESQWGNCVWWCYGRVLGADLGKTPHTHTEYPHPDVVLHEGYVITKPFGFVRPQVSPTTFNYWTSGSTFTEPGVYVMPLKVTSTSYTLISSVNNNNMADAQTWGWGWHIVGSPNNKCWQSL